jgi:short-subunit dehydrogenase
MPREQGALTWLTIRVLAMLAVPAWRISMARVLIIGASKGIGLETTRQGLEAGYQVRALARSAARIGLSDPKLEKVHGERAD